MRGAAVHRVLEAVRAAGGEVKLNGARWLATCPGHDDEDPSMGVTQGQEGVLLYCHPCGVDGNVLAPLLGLEVCELFDSWEANGARTEITLARYAGYVRLPIDFLRCVGTEDGTCYGQPAVVIPYRDEGGNIIATRYRTALPGGFLWQKGSRLALYNLPALPRARRAGEVVVVEGESDVHVLAYAEIPALGIPGAGSWKDEWAPMFDGIGTIYLVREDEAGDRLLDAVRRSAIAERVQVIRMPSGMKDPRDLWRSVAPDVAGFRNRWAASISEATPLSRVPRDYLEVQGDDHAPEGSVSSPSPAPVLAWRPFPTAVLGVQLAEYVRKVAWALGVDESFVALPVLCILAGVVGNRYRIELKDGTWWEPAVLWGAIVARSGRLKSPALAEVTRPVRRREDEMIQQYRETLAEHERAVADWNEQDRGQRGSKPAPPAPPPRSLVSDVTVEALVARLAESPAGVLLYRDELAGWIRSFDAYKSGRGGDAQAWLEMHRAGSVIVDRKSGEPLSVPLAAVSVVGSVQPEVLWSALQVEHLVDGLAARMLFAMPPDRPKKWTDVSIPDSVRESWSRLLDRLRTPFERASVPIDLPLTPQAQCLFVEFYNRHADRVADAATDSVAAALAKLEGGAARFALLLQLARDPDSCAVDADAMRAGVMLAEWFANEAGRVYGMFYETPADREHRELVEWITTHGGQVTERDVQRGRRRYRKPGAATVALEALVRHGTGAWKHHVPGPTGGRPVRVFVLGDSGDGDTTGSVASGDTASEVDTGRDDNPATQLPTSGGVVSPSPPAESMERGLSTPLGDNGKSAFQRWAERIDKRDARSWDNGSGYRYDDEDAPLQIDGAEAGALTGLDTIQRLRETGVPRGVQPC